MGIIPGGNAIYIGGKTLAFGASIGVTRETHQQDHSIVFGNWYAKIFLRIVLHLHGLRVIPGKDNRVKIKQIR